MPLRRHILALALLPSLAGCHRAPPPAPAPPATFAATPGVPRARIARAVDALFAEPKAGATRALIVLRDGEPIAERYAPGFTAATPQIGWSMSKCVTALLIGLLVSDGRLRLDGTAPVPAWQRPGDPRGAISPRMLLQMRAGLRHAETARPVYASDVARMLFLDGRDDMAGYAEAKPLATAPGKVFAYSTASTIILDDLAARALTDSADADTRRRAVNEYLRARLFDPLGVRSMIVEADARGTLIGASAAWATPRDWGRIGEFLRERGAVRGAQIVPRGWIGFMLAPSPADPGYGAQVWLNRRHADGSDPLFAGKAPRDVFACIGYLGQYVIVSPSQRLTIVRMGNTRGGGGALRARLLAILKLFPRAGVS